MDSNIWL